MAIEDWGNSPSNVFSVFQPLWDTGKEDTATVNSKSMQGSFWVRTTCHAPQSDLPKCVDFRAGVLAWTIHCYSFFLTMYTLQRSTFDYWQETPPQKVPITVNYQDQRHDVDYYTFDAIDTSSMVLVLMCQMSTLLSNHRKINHQTASARTRRKDIMKGIRGDGKVLE